MNIFQVVKENVTARQAAEQYGLKVNKNGMVCCPFHDDRHPSMKVDKGFCCFACGAKGDVITFVVDSFHLAPLEAAKKLAEDFQIPIFTDNAKKRNDSKKKEKPKRTLYQTEKKFEEWERESIHILSDYLHLVTGKSPVSRFCLSGDISPITKTASRKSCWINWLNALICRCLLYTSRCV